MVKNFKFSGLGNWNFFSDSVGTVGFNSKVELVWNFAVNVMLILSLIATISGSLVRTNQWQNNDCKIQFF